MEKILIIEDDADIQELLSVFLKEAGYRTTIASDGVEALLKFEHDKYDLILLDVMLPKIDGFGVCEVMRQQSDVPIIMLTALDDERNQVKGLDLGIDDYIIKPFAIQVLIRKIKAVLRRYHHCDETDHILSYKRLKLDVKGYLAFMDEKEIELTQKEFELMREFILHQGQVLTRKSLLDRVWGYDYFGEERIVDTHIKNLRKKMGMDYIRTIRGVGYRLDRENKR